MEKNSLLQELPESSWPRERLLREGEKHLSDQELLAIILRNGSRQQNVMELAGNILREYSTLYELKYTTLQELQQFKGIGETRAIELKAMMEFGYRIYRALQPKLGKIQSSFSFGQFLITELKDYRQEHLVAFFLNTKNEIIFRKTIFIGSLNQSIAHPREIFREAVRTSAARVVLGHNHPSGNPLPSQNDLEFTERVRECGAMMGIELLDHIIVGETKYFSLREEKYLK
ncbi:RadC family protein [Enterococcus xiangfangensis]|uniref:DNA repair protein RadC n=1 Tax=Enterococcus xiangfangensis TaxID=1296537 RepID=A0ABU3FAA8_9ENTE|nr:DNA repair protein RadC [Enterococcus xiangfangensis]MBM7712677.1 DNA repair protein RadC [Enterococcus xiangfangensis]MDT2759613.1 DNA repair protein RadC [Enterococcus xiangfangensis]